LTWVADQLAINEVNKRVKEMILKENKMVTKEEQDTMMQLFKDEFFKKGNKHLLEVLKDEFEDVEIKVGVNIAGKQKNLAALSDKVLSILQVAIANPQFRQNLEANGMTGAFNDLLEYSGISPVTFNNFTQAQPVVSPMQPQQQQSTPQLLPSQPTQ